VGESKSLTGVSRAMGRLEGGESERLTGAPDAARASGRVVDEGGLAGHVRAAAPGASAAVGVAAGLVLGVALCVALCVLSAAAGVAMTAPSSAPVSTALVVLAPVAAPGSAPVSAAHVVLAPTAGATSAPSSTPVSAAHVVGRVVPTCPLSPGAVPRANLSQVWEQGQERPDCGGERPTNLAATAARFAERAREAGSAGEPSCALRFDARRERIVFRAYDADGRARSLGGDHFVVTLWGWDRGGEDGQARAFKSTRVAEDLFDGSYAASLNVPRGLLRVNVSLVLLFSCHQGLSVLPADAKNVVTVYGPVPVMPNASFVEAWSKPVALAALDPPLCAATQAGMDALHDGIWVQGNGLALGEELSPDKATWEPLSCLSLRTSGGPRVFRAGDSTMPGRVDGDVGNVFLPNAVRAYRNKWVDYLAHQFRSSKSSDTLSMNGSGMHYVQDFQGPEAASLILTQICQAASVFKGKIELIGTMPVHNQLYPSSRVRDEKAGSVLWVNQLLRAEIGRAKGSLRSLCMERDFATLLLSSDKRGNIVPPPPDAVANVLNEDALAVLRAMRAVNRSEVFSGRSVLMGEVHDALLARPEAYRDKDKIHDNGALFFGEHSVIVDTYAQLRSEAGP
jgi:hypothetical protein